MCTNNNDKDYVLWRNLGLLGLLGATMVGVGEFMIHYTPEGFSDTSFDFFGNVSDRSLRLGHFIMIPFIPLYIFGYLHFYLGLRSGSEKLARTVFILGVFAFMIGAIWVGSRAFIGSLQHLLDKPDTIDIWKQVVSLYDFYLENLVQGLRILMLALSLVFTITILKGNTVYPHWFAACPPIVPLILIFLSYLFIPTIGNYLLPAAMNLSHIVVFGLSLLSGSKTFTNRTKDHENRHNSPS